MRLQYYIVERSSIGHQASGTLVVCKKALIDQLNLHYRPAAWYGSEDMVQSRHQHVLNDHINEGSVSTPQASPLHELLRNSTVE